MFDFSTVLMPLILFFSTFLDLSTSDVCSKVSKARVTYYFDAYGCFFREYSFKIQIFTDELVIFSYLFIFLNIFIQN